MSDTPPVPDNFEGSGAFEESGVFEGSGQEHQVSGIEDGGGEEGGDEGPVYYFLEESTGYMQPTLSFLAIMHTVIAFICIIGYNCLKVGLSHTCDFISYLSVLHPRAAKTIKDVVGSFKNHN